MKDTAIARVEDMLKGNFNYNDHKISTAYALNLCTVSISQIIDYEDIVILEQEYDAILNNLNIENLPNDEALLAILKQLLDTITFFRIQEVEKDFIDREYQNKMKNAIWNAVPNMGMIIAGGKPLTLAISLAAQVGVGYMNYRKTKAENAFALEKAKWQLQRAAIDQFNGLRRELFDTAWRLVNAHEIPDEYRLTERQVKQYNEILMDSNPKRKYERLNTIKHNFVAYPPFWYFFGHTANTLSRLYTGQDAMIYRGKAKEYFEIFVKAFSACNLLRENQVASACALEYIDLLDPRNTSENIKIRELLQFAVKMSGNANDVLQLCAFGYLRAGDSMEAASLFRRLVNEDYNTVVNAQLLSSYYVSAWLSGDKTAELKYRDLEERVDLRYLYPFPAKQASKKDAYGQLTTIQDQFAENQRAILEMKYMMVLNKFKEKYQILFNRCIPVPDGKVKPDSYYAETTEAYGERKENGKILRNRHNMEEYTAVLNRIDYPLNYLDVFNDMLNDINLLNCAQPYENNLHQLMSKGILKDQAFFNSIYRFLKTDNIIDITSYYKMLDLSFESLTADFFEALKEYAKKYIDQKSTIIDLNDAETNLREFCMQQGFETPEVIFETANILVETPPVQKKYLAVELITEGITTQEVNDRFETVREIISTYIPKVCRVGNNVQMIMCDEEAFDRYFVRLEIPNKAQIRKKTVAVLDDMSSRDNDLIFTTEGVMQVVRGKMQKPMPYNDIYFSPADFAVLLAKPYFLQEVNMLSLREMLIKLRTKPYEKAKEKKGFWLRR